jgi:hypothetical protein
VSLFSFLYTVITICFGGGEVLTLPCRKLKASLTGVILPATDTKVKSFWAITNPLSSVVTLLVSLTHVCLPRDSTEKSLHALHCDNIVVHEILLKYEAGNMNIIVVF